MALTNHIVPDSPTNNFATWNALNYKGNSLLDGNLNHYITTTASNYAEEALGTIAFDAANSSVYFETYIKNGDTSGGSGARSGIGIVPSNAVAGTFGNAFSLIGSYVFFGGNSQFYSGTYSTATANVWYSSGTSYGSNLAIGDIVGVFINNGSLYYSINGSWVNSSDGTFANVSAAAKTNMTGYKVPAILTYLNGNNDGQVYLNTGQDPTFGGNKTSGSADAPDANGIGAFYYQPPTDALALCTANLPEMTPTVTGDVPQEYFKAVIWSGTGSDQNVDLGFNADLVWAKRTNGNDSHRLYDSIRGEDRDLITNYVGSENTIGYGLGFINSNTRLEIAGNNFHGGSGNSFVAWCWKSGGSPSATDDGTGVSGSAKLVDTSGAASSTTCKAFKDAAVTAGASNVICPTKMSINQAAGFSIVKWTGTGANATVPHGLSSAPEIIIDKNLDDTGGRNWIVYHHKVSSTPHKDFLYLNEPDDVAAQPLYWNNTYPTSSVFSLGSAGATNRDGDAHIAYCWHSVEGYSKFGSYTGNGSPDGPFVYCGFRPAFVMVKNTDLTGSSWFIWDSKRSPNNEMKNALLANDSLDELNDREIDFLSNGFKPRANDGNYNQNYTYIYMAFAEQPFKFSNAR